MAYTPKGVLAGDQTGADTANWNFKGLGSRLGGIGRTVQHGIDVRDVKRLITKLDNYGKRVRGAVLRKALREGAKVVQAELKRNSPVLQKQRKRKSRRFNAQAGRQSFLRLNSRPRKSPQPVRGLLKRSWGVRAMKRKKDRTGAIVITGRLYGAAYYGWFLEEGTHRLDKGIKRQHRKGFAAKHGTERIKPRKFIARSFKNAKAPAMAAVRRHLKSGLAEAAAKSATAGGGDA